MPNLEIDNFSSKLKDDGNNSKTKKLKTSLLPYKFRESGLKPPGVGKAMTSTPPAKGKVIQRNYVLSDAEAIKKKIKAESRKYDTAFKEAKDGSNASINLKASLFEFVKAYFINDLQENAEILSVGNAEAIKVNSESAGEAFV